MSANVNDVGPTPIQAIRLAKGGSYYDIYAIVNNSERGYPTIPRKYHESLFEAFCTHVGKPRSELEKAKDKTSKTSVIMFSLLGITLFESDIFKRSSKSTALLVKRWPDMLRWLEFLYDEPLPNWPSKTGFPSGLIKIIHSMVELLSDCPEARECFQSLELFRFAAKVWLEDKRPKDESDDSYAASILAMTCETVIDMNERLDILIEMSNESEWDVADLAVHRLASASRHALKQKPDLVAAFNHTEVFFQLARTKKHPLHKDIMAFRPIPLVIKCLLRYIVFSNTERRDNLGILAVRAFDILYTTIDTRDSAVVYTIEALRSGLLEAFIKAAPLMDDFDRDGDWASAVLLLQLMICQLSLVTLLGPTIRAFLRLEAKGADKLPEDCPSQFRDLWGRYKSTAFDRWARRLLYSRRRCCGNVRCFLVYLYALTERECKEKLREHRLRQNIQNVHGV